ncbi:hypothetical protein EP1X_02425 [Thermococcus sp. EP1]|uniref:hypothetical protein n=1 Tax=Thermococcus sp. EP1 TaxID=1591054 RepID=UPI0006DA0B53|nr:hypothetical protein [Thermococcus sp. EP1]KPU64059.1 hypothetical protein EP1X_02425 [Thermococcus sp. EP1]
MDLDLFMEKYGFKILLLLVFGVPAVMIGIFLIAPALPDLFRGEYSEALQIIAFILLFAVVLGGIANKSRVFAGGIFGRYWYKWKR